MIDARYSYNILKEEVNEYFIFLNDLITLESKIIDNEGIKKRVNTTLSCTLKSTAFLLLYNLIESTIYNSLQVIHDELNKSETRYPELHERIQEIWLEYCIGKKSNFIAISKEIINHTITENHIEIDLEKYLNIKNLFSGNLDARKIREVANKYGCIIKGTGCGEKLIIVKNVRNKLAHGEISFSKGSKDYTMTELNAIKDDVINFLNHTLNTIEEYILKRLFLSPDKASITEKSQKELQLTNS
jgi:MAE_28990/MAE_18760-like HEPN